MSNLKALQAHTEVGPGLSGGPRGETLRLASASRGGPCTPIPASNTGFCLWSNLPPPPSQELLVLILRAHPDSPRRSPHFKILDLLTSAKSPLRGHIAGLGDWDMGFC